MHITSALIHALPPHQRRVLNRAEAASYVCVSPGYFDKLVATGIYPNALPYGGLKRWDRVALDLALDRASGTTGSTTDAPGAYDTWKTAHGQG